MLRGVQQQSAELPSITPASATVAVIATAAILGSLCVWFAIFRKLAAEEPLLKSHFAYRRSVVPIGPLIFALGWILLNLWLMLLKNQASAFEPDLVVDALLSALLTGILVTVALVVLLLTGIPHRHHLIRLGFRTDGLGQQVGIGVLGFVAALLPVYLFRISTSPFQSEEVVHPLLRVFQEHALAPEMILVILLAVVLAPIQEELLFRVILQSWVEQFASSMGAIIVSATLFSAVHGFPDAVGLLPLAVILGYVYQRTRSYVAVVVLHACFNAFNLFLALLMTMIELRA